MRGIAGLRSICVALLALALPSVAMAGVTVTTPVVAPPPVDDGPVYAIPTRPDAIGRVMAPVYVNGRGPFLFIVDTGANRTVLSPHLARRLGVDTAAAPQQLVHGVTGAEPAPIVRVDDVRFGRLARSAIDVPVLSNRLHATADGMLGADHMRGGRLLIDFKRDRIELGASSSASPPSFFVMPATMRFGQLPLVSARLGHVTVKAVIDTGAERSIGNSALRRMLERQHARLEDEGMTTVYGAVGPDAQAALVWAPRLVLAGVRIERLPILFADTHFFKLWELENEPALLIGMDVLGQLDTLVIDYRRREVCFRIATGNPGVNWRARASRL